MVHKWRAEEDAIMVGTNTAKHDNPKLNVRDWHGDDPLRIVIDKKLALPEDLHLFSDGSATICFNQVVNKTVNSVRYIQLEGQDFIGQILAYLNEQKIQSLIVEGGTELLKSFIKNNLWDEARIFKSKTIFGEGIASPTMAIDNKLLSQPEKEIAVQGDNLIYIRNRF